MLAMFRALPAVIFVFLSATAAWAQNEPPPDTKPARERHRIAAHEPPPPDGPWGPDEVGLTWHNPVWRGLFGSVGPYEGNSMSFDLPTALASRSDGINPPYFEKMEYKSGSFRTTSGALTADLDMLRFSLAWYQGTFDARGTLTKDDGFAPPQTTDVDLHGNLRGFRIGMHWPALRYREMLTELSPSAFGIDASLGPIASVGWMHGETIGVPGATLLSRDAFDVLTGSIGPKASFRAFWGSVSLDLSADYSFLTGAVRGWTREFTVGVGIKF